MLLPIQWFQNYTMTSAGETIVILLLFAPLLLFFSVRRILKPPTKLPPGPYPWPIVGNLFQLRTTNNVHIRLADMAQVHGPLMSLRLGHRLLVIGSSSAAASDILKTNDHILSARDVSSLLIGKEPTLHNTNLVLSDDESSRRFFRNLYTSKIFSSKALESYEKMRGSKVMEMVRYIASKNGEEAVIIKDAMFVTAINILGNTLLSVDLVDYDGNGAGAAIKDSVRRLSVLGATPQLADLYPVFAGWDLQGWYKEVMDIVDSDLGSIWKDLLRRKRNSGRNENSSSVKDFADISIEKGFTDQQINAFMEELFSAGTDSLSLTIEWFMAELLKNQQVMQKVKDEVRTMIMDHDHEIYGNIVVHESDLVRLPFLEACFKETLRLHPPAPLLLPHKASQSCNIMGYTVPKDSQILVNVWAINRDPKTWDDPLSFKPERFIDSKLSYKGKDFEYLPFGGGRRMCPADAMASKTILVTVASLIRNFDWFLPNNGDPISIDMEEVFGVPVHKKEPLFVIFKIREEFKN